MDPSHALCHPPELVRGQSGGILAREVRQADDARHGAARRNGGRPDRPRPELSRSSRGDSGDRRPAHRRPRPDDQRLRHALLHQSGLQARRLHESGPGREARGDRSDEEGHRRDPRGRQQPDDALARPGRLRLRLPGGLRRGVVDGGRRHPRGRRARPRLHDQHRVQAERAARLQPARHLRLDPARDPGGGLPRTSASPSTSPTSSMPTSSPPSRRRSRIATAGFSASTSTTATPSATTG